MTKKLLPVWLPFFAFVAMPVCLVGPPRNVKAFHAGQPTNYFWAAFHAKKRIP